MVPTCKNVAPYSSTSLNVGTMVNAPLCNNLYLFLCSQPKMVQYGARNIFLAPLVRALRLSKKKTKRGKCRGRYLRVGAPSL